VDFGGRNWQAHEDKRLAKYQQLVANLDCATYALGMESHMQFFEQYLDAAPANESRRAAQQCRTATITNSKLCVPGYPNKLVIFKMPASQFWQIRCFMGSRTHTKSTKTTNQRIAMNSAREFYNVLCAKFFQQHNPVGEIHSRPTKQPAHLTFAAQAAQMYASEQARVERGEFNRGSLQVMQNRLNAHVLPTLGKQQVSSIDYKTILEFSHQLSREYSSTTVSQYLVIVRKVLVHAKLSGLIEVLPEFPKIKIISSPRSAFTPTEYWQLLRQCRAMINRSHPLGTTELRRQYQLTAADSCVPIDLSWVITFMVNSFIRPSDLRTLKHRHVEIVRHGTVQYLRLTLPETKKHGAPIVTLQPAVRIYQQIVKQRSITGQATPDDYLFLPQHKDRDYALKILSVMFSWLLNELGLKQGAHGTNRTLYCLRHSAITFRLLYGSGIDLLTLARNARTSVDMIQRFYASTVSPEQNIRMLHSKRTRMLNP